MGYCSRKGYDDNRMSAFGDSGSLDGWCSTHPKARHEDGEFLLVFGLRAHFDETGGCLLLVEG